MIPNESDEIRVALTDDEYSMMFNALVDWGGPSHPTESLAIALGFSSADDLEEQCHRIADTIAAGRGLSERDWTRALVCTEILFASNVFGDGDEWTVIHAGSDAGWIEVLRRLQEKVPWSLEHLGP